MMLRSPALGRPLYSVTSRRRSRRSACQELGLERSCVTRMTHVDRRAERPELTVGFVSRSPVQGVERLVEQQHPGRIASARARASRCRSPPESWAGFRWASGARRNRSRSSFASSARPAAWRMRRSLPRSCGETARSSERRTRLPLPGEAVSPSPEKTPLCPRRGFSPIRVGEPAMQFSTWFFLHRGTPQDAVSLPSIIIAALRRNDGSCFSKLTRIIWRRLCAGKEHAPLRPSLPRPRGRTKSPPSRQAGCWHPCSAPFNGAVQGQGIVCVLPGMLPANHQRSPTPPARVPATGPSPPGCPARRWQRDAEENPPLRYNRVSAPPARTELHAPQRSLAALVHEGRETTNEAMTASDPREHDGEADWSSAPPRSPRFPKSTRTGSR